MRRTKIVATLGPASDSVEVIKRLIEAGMDTARINFSHGTHEEHAAKINNLKSVRKELNKPIPLILDTKGPEIRIKTFKKEPITLKRGNTFILTTDDIEGDENRVSVTYADFPNDLSPGASVLIDDGLIELSVKEIKGSDIICKVLNNGTLSSRKGVNVPNLHVNLPALTEKDVDDIKFGIKMGFDYIAASFIRSASDVMEIRKVLDTNGGSHIHIISKIESRDGVNNIDSILEVSDGVMVARGDLGVEIPLEEVPIIQKELIRKCRIKGRPVITATQMLESMVNNPRPTRAEANDVANAIYDGTDAIMLSGETAKGCFPVEAVETMVKIANKAENSIDYVAKFSEQSTLRMSNITNAISHATCTTAMDLNAVCIAAVSNSGFTVNKVAKYRPNCPILALTPHEVVQRQLNLVWGCSPFLMEKVASNVDVLFDNVSNKAMETGYAKSGDIIVIVGGTPIGMTGTTNTMKVQIVGDVMIKGRAIGNRIVSGRVNIYNPSSEETPFFNKGDILVCKKTDDSMVEIMRKASAIIIGNGNHDDFSHAETVARTLDIPILISDQNVAEMIPNSIIITLDAKNGLIYNGAK